MIATPYDQIVDQFDRARVALQPCEAECLALLIGNLGSNAAIFALGCGTGQPIATHVAGLGHRIVGVDASAGMLGRARARLPEHRWIHDRIGSVEFDQAFDAVICWDALFHVPRIHRPRVVSRIRGWLRPDGRLMVSSGGIVHGEDGFTDTMFVTRSTTTACLPTRC